MQAVHSTERTWMRRSTGRSCGQALAHLPHSMQASVVAADGDGAEERGQRLHGSVGAGVAAPEIFDDDGEQHEDGDDDERGGAHAHEEVQHFDVGEDAVGLCHEVFEGGGAHAADDEDEEGHEQVLDAAQGNVEPAGQDEVALEELAAQLPEVFGEGSDGAEPGAEGALEERGCMARKMRNRTMAAG